MRTRSSSSPGLFQFAVEMLAILLLLGLAFALLGCASAVDRVVKDARNGLAVAAAYDPIPGDDAVLQLELLQRAVMNMGLTLAVEEAPQVCTIVADAAGNPTGGLSCEVAGGYMGWASQYQCVPPGYMVVEYVCIRNYDGVIIGGGICNTGMPCSVGCEPEDEWCYA